MSAYRRLKDCDCWFCRDAEASTPDTAGEYGGIDRHMRALDRDLARAVALLRRWEDYEDTVVETEHADQTLLPDTRAFLASQETPK